MTENNLPIAAQVRLTATAAERQPELAGQVGRVHGLGPGWAEVAWPRFRSWCRSGDLEVAL